MKLKYFSPILIDILLICWTLAVSPYSKYGDNWAIYPAIILFPVLILVHTILIFIDKNKLACSIYGIIHIFFVFFLWIYCLMKISKDAL